MNRLIRSFVVVLFVFGTVFTAVPPGAFAAPVQVVFPSLQEPLSILERSRFEGPIIAETIRNTGTTVGFESETDFPAGTIAAYYPLENVITISDTYRNADPNTLAAILAHEGTHLIDDRLYQKDGTRARPERGFDPYTCIAREFDAFGTAVRFWSRTFPAGPNNPEGGKPGASNLVEEHLNALLRVNSSDEAIAQVAGIVGLYLRPDDQCGAEAPTLAPSLPGSVSVPGAPPTPTTPSTPGGSADGVGSPITTPSTTTAPGSSSNPGSSTSSLETSAAGTTGPTRGGATATTGGATGSTDLPTTLPNTGGLPVSLAELTLLATAVAGAGYGLRRLANR